MPYNTSEVPPRIENPGPCKIDCAINRSILRSASSAGNVSTSKLATSGMLCSNFVPILFTREAGIATSPPFLVLSLPQLINYVTSIAEILVVLPPVDHSLSSDPFTSMINSLSNGNVLKIRSGPLRSNASSAKPCFQPFPSSPTT